MPTRINAAAVKRFLDAKKASQNCHRCGHSAFTVEDETASDARPILLNVKFPDFDMEGSNAMEMVLVSCLNCGEAQLYLRKVIAEWLDANP